MNDVRPLDRQAADSYAALFKALADGTRVQVVSLLARAGRPLTVKEIVAAVPVGQSTVSEHLRQLARLGFVLAEERGTSRLYRINGDCVSCFPTAADLVMGRPPPVPSAGQDHDEVRAAVVARYAGLPRAAQGAGARIEAMTDAHAAAVLAIYQAGIDEGNATFETRAPRWDAFCAARLPGHRFVAVAADQVTGWVAVSPGSGRGVYAGVVEHSVYVHPAARGQGTGRALLAALIASTEAAGIWTIQSSIFPENEATVALHRAAGFRVVGTRVRIAQHHGRWRDTLLLERRSPAV